MRMEKSLQRSITPCRSTCNPVSNTSDMGRATFPRQRKTTAEVLSLPIFPGISGEEMERVCDAVNGA